MLQTRTRRGVTFAVLLSAVLLTACSPETSTVIRLGGDDTFVISAREECDYVLDDIEVRYMLDNAAYDDMPLLWTATARDGGGSRQVSLFRPNSGYEVHRAVSDVDGSREVIVGWSKRYPDGNVVEHAVGGVLAELGDDNLIWFGGLTSVADYEWQRVIPWNSWDC